MFLLEGYTRPAMKQAKGISTTSDEGLYRCCIICDKTTGEILAGRDYSCPAGKRGFCKHVAALAYKLVEATMSSKKELPKPISCTELRQQWGIPSLKAQNDPEKELMKRKPLHEIVCEKHEASRDQTGGRKRKLPAEVSYNYTSRTRGEPAVDQERIKALCGDLAESQCPKVVTRILKLNHMQHNENIQDNIEKVSVQRSSEWFNDRIGKITSSKAPAVILGRKEFEEKWHCIKNKKQEPQKYFKNFERGILFEDEDAKLFAKESGAVLKECGLYPLKSDGNYAASPDRIIRRNMQERFRSKNRETSNTSRFVSPGS